VDRSSSCRLRIEARDFRCCRVWTGGDPPAEGHAAESVGVGAIEADGIAVPRRRMSSGVKVKTWEETSVGSSPLIVPVTTGLMERSSLDGGRA